MATWALAISFRCFPKKRDGSASLGEQFVVLICVLYSDKISQGGHKQVEEKTADSVAYTSLKGNVIKCQ